jgi:hypothetical protein
VRRAEAGAGEPAVVLEAGLGNGAASWQRVTMRAGRAQLGRHPCRFRAHWTRLQAGLAAAAPQGRHVIVDGTGHNIPGNRPDVVAGTILAVVAQARASRG